MQTTSQPLPTSPSSAPAAWPLSRSLILLICVVFPVWGGSILFFAWRGKHPEAARFANRISWTVFGFIFVMAAGYGAIRAHLRPGGGRAAPAIHAPAP